MQGFTPVFQPCCSSTTCPLSPSFPLFGARSWTRRKRCCHTRLSTGGVMPVTECMWLCCTMRTLFCIGLNLSEVLQHRHSNLLQTAPGRSGIAVRISLVVTFGAMDVTYIAPVPCNLWGDTASGCVSVGVSSLVCLSGRVSVGTSQWVCLSGHISVGVSQWVCLGGCVSVGVSQWACLGGCVSVGTPQWVCLSRCVSVGVSQQWAHLSGCGQWVCSVGVSQWVCLSGCVSEGVSQWVCQCCTHSSNTAAPSAVGDGGTRSNGEQLLPTD